MKNRKEQFSDLIFDYAVCRRFTARVAKTTTNPESRTVLNSITRDLDDSIEYMETGVPPWEYQSDLRAPRRRISLIADEHLLSVLKSKQGEVSGEEKDMTFDVALIEDLLKTLSTREKECYLLIKQSLFTYESTADMLNISVGSVKKHMQRATEKIEKNKKDNPFVSLKEWD